MILLNVTSFRVFKLNWYKSHIDLNNSHFNLINSHFNLIFLYFNLIMFYIWIDHMYLTPHNERSSYSCTFPPPDTMKHWNMIRYLIIAIFIFHAIACHSGANAELYMESGLVRKDLGFGIKQHNQCAILHWLLNDKQLHEI